MSKKRTPSGHPEWAIAHVLVEWQRTAGRKLRAAYKYEPNSETQRRLAGEVAEQIEGFARALRLVEAGEA